jgi:hypothetical protein
MGALMKSKETIHATRFGTSKTIRKSFTKKRKEEMVQPKALQSKGEPQHQLGRKFTPLNTNIVDVFMEIKSDPNFKWPPRMRTPSNKRTNQGFCEYHNDHGHLTKECISLRHEIENFIRNGKLVRFLVEERSRGRDCQEPLRITDALERRQGDRVVRPRRETESRLAPEDHQNPQNQDVIGEIHTISRGLASGGKSNSAHARSVNVEEILFLRPSKAQKKNLIILSFSEEDAEGVAMPHDDALVIMVTIANHAIHRILVDNGSSADILYWFVFKQMRIDHNRIKPFSSPLIGFIGEQVQPMRIISLPVTARTAP